MARTKSSGTIETAPGQTERSKKSDVPAVEKALDVLELLSEKPNGLTMNELTGALSRSMGEIYRIVIYLASRGYLQRDTETDKYTVTLRMFELSHRYEPTDNLLKLATPVLERISFRTEQSCHLAVLYQMSVLVLASIPSPRPAGYSVKTGSVFPFLRTSSGAVILSFLEQNQRDRYLASLPPGDQSALIERIGRIRANGFEKAPSSLVHGVTSISAPVFSRDGVIAAVTSGFVLQADQRSSLEDMQVEIRDSARYLSEHLGGSANAATYLGPRVPA